MAATTTKEFFAAFMQDESLLQRLIVHAVNNRIQEFSDPLTSTLYFLATSPLQLVFCESGLIFFKTSLLPIFPYNLLFPLEKQHLEQWVHATQEDHESCDSSGQFTLTVPLAPKQPLLYLCKKTLLMSFVHVMRHHNGTFNNPAICCTLCNIILQRFMATVPVSSDIMNLVMQLLNNAAPNPALLCPLMCQPSDLHFALIALPITAAPALLTVNEAPNTTTKANKRKRTPQQESSTKKKKCPSSSFSYKSASPT
jgi:hypothetical protein